ncbi:MAG: sugar ABC transporter permease [Acidimicrobiia bacterium]|nr:sugar ABC transporter permease [Acidimicrobiia bacterium]
MTAPPLTAETRREVGSTPAWFTPLLVWRVLVAAGFAVLLTTRRGIAIEGANRVLVLAGVTLALFVAMLAGYQTYRRRHLGRLLGFTVDLLTASVTGFMALNRMSFFNGLDAVGERFNRNIIWLVVIVAGWLISGWSERGGLSRPRIQRIGRYIMAGGAAIMVLAMGLLGAIPGVLANIADLEVVPVLGVAIVAALFARIQIGESAARLFGTTQSQSEGFDGLLFIAPNALGFLAFFAGPLIFSLVISFTEWSGLQPAEFVGLANYRELLGDALFLRSLRNIVIFGLVAVPLTVAPALLLAALLNSKLPGIRVFRAIYFLPSIAGVVGVTLIWKQLFNATVGFLNYSILEVTEFFNGLFGTAVAAPQPLWISAPEVAMISVIILFVWQRIGFDTVLFLAGMQGIDRSLYEAADIDGAGAWTRFRHITVPMLRPTTFFVVATDIILALQTFNEPFILQAPSTPAGPGNSTLTPVIYLYQQAFQQFQIGYGSAVAWALFILIFGITIIYFRRQGEDGFLKA